MLADDSTIIKCEQNAIPLFDSNIGLMLKWFVDNKLTISEEKREAVCFELKQPHDFSLMAKAKTYQNSCK